MEVKQGKTLFTCKECDLAYSEKKWALACEEFCRKNKSCSLEITRHAAK